MKRDPQHPVSFSGSSIQCGPEVLTLFRNPRGKRVAISKAAEDSPDGICHGLKRMPVERRRKDGATVGQVYLRGAQWKGVVTDCLLPDGTPSSFILAIIPRVRGLVLPCPLDREAWNASGRPVGLPLEAFAFMAGLDDLTVAREVQEALLNRGKLDGFTVEEREWKLPDGVEPFVAPWGLGERGEYLAAGLDGSLEWKEWRRLLGWEGRGSALAAIELRDAILSGRGRLTEGLIDFP